MPAVLPSESAAGQVDRTDDPRPPRHGREPGPAAAVCRRLTRRHRRSHGPPGRAADVGSQSIDAGLSPGLPDRPTCRAYRLHRRGSEPWFDERGITRNHGGPPPCAGAQDPRRLGATGARQGGCRAAQGATDPHRFAAGGDRPAGRDPRALHDRTRRRGSAGLAGEGARVSGCARTASCSSPTSRSRPSTTAARSAATRRSCRI